MEIHVLIVLRELISRKSIEVKVTAKIALLSAKYVKKQNAYLANGVN